MIFLIAFQLAGRSPVGFAAISIAVVLANVPGPVLAQMKVGGSDPAALANGATFQVDRGAGTLLFVGETDKTGRVGIGTSSPQNTLHVNGGVLLEDNKNAAFLGTDSSGNVQSVPLTTVAAACTCGDIKAGLQTSDHGNWKLMNGRYQKTSNCDVPVVDATRRLLVQAGGVVGASSGADGVLILQGNLPTATLRPGGFTRNPDGTVVAGGYGLVRRSQAGEFKTTDGADTTGAGFEPDVISVPIVPEVLLNPGAQAPIGLSTNNMPRVEVKESLHKSADADLIR